jgi:hypothetical protein
MDKLMLFRTIYLRSIAESWANGDFRSALLDNPTQAMNDYFGFSWPWTNICKLTILPPYLMEQLGVPVQVSVRKGLALEGSVPSSSGSAIDGYGPGTRARA